MEICPTKSILLGVGQYVIDADTCDDCEVCVSVCPENAILCLDPPKEPEKTDSADATKTTKAKNK